MKMQPICLLYSIIHVILPAVKCKINVVKKEIPITLTAFYNFPQLKFYIV